MPYSATSVSGASLHIHRWEPNTPVTAQLILCHGYAEHAMRYLPLVKALNEIGVRVIAPDHVGHGRSEGLRGYVERIEILVDDVSNLVQKAYDTAPNLPLFLFGHSMGGVISVQVAERHQDLIRGLILSGPALHIANTPKFLQLLSPIPAMFLPKVPFLPLKSSAVSRDPEASKRYRDDPFNYVGKVRFGTGWQLIRGGRMALGVAGNIHLPLWVGHGREDGLAGLSGTWEFLGKIKSTDITYRDIPEARHEILNEPEGPGLIQEICEWVRERI